jgi:hypothetical protein
MDGKSLDGLKQWKCKNNHLLGIVEQVQVSSNGSKYHVSRLILFRQAIDLDPKSTMSLADVDVIGNIEGTVMDIRCSVPGCGEVRTWWMGEASLERFLESRKEKVA